MLCHSPADSKWYLVTATLSDYYITVILSVSPQKRAPAIKAKHEIEHVEWQQREEVVPERSFLHVVSHNQSPVSLEDSGVVEEHDPRLDEYHVEDADAVAEVVEHGPPQVAAVRLVRGPEGEAQRDDPRVVQQHDRLHAQEERAVVALRVDG